MKTVITSMGQGAAKIFVAVGVIAVFFLWGYAHQLFGFVDCGGGKPDISLVGIVAGGFGMTTCTEPSRSSKN